MKREQLIKALLCDGEDCDDDCPYMVCGQPECYTEALTRDAADKLEAYGCEPEEVDHMARILSNVRCSLGLSTIEELNEAAMNGRLGLQGKFGKNATRSREQMRAENRLLIGRT